MENRTEFNLENNINQWKQELTEKNNLTKSNIIELESHLLDLIQDIESKGLNKEESFIIARKRMGKTNDITIEFDKVNNDFSYIKKLIPYFKGALIYITFITLSKSFFIISLILSISKGLDVNNMFNTISIILLAFTCVTFFSVIYLNLNNRKTFLSKLNNTKTLIALIIISPIITYRLYNQITALGIRPFVSSKSSTLLELLSDFTSHDNSYIMETKFISYQTFSALIIFSVSIFFIWKNKQSNRLNISK
ncbi:hypothetical protein QVZ41_14090 [Wenyingzhuangia sp. chi5]|uniref:Uncharacterized protein n=1 Tax=Wenyingzhuangia gilva TaxID=3057677 RepID=A0ABT8VVI2_9FLAO|nr:hypothetical protein [Wenyingzhuangia sp. chi5]MDO3695978.1 hypothetical protein [Wenyingzhuangia sp. chi5]